MLFNSFTFIFFFVVVFVLHWSLSNKFRWILLLIASYFFYVSWETSYILLILISTGIDYFLCRFLTGSSNQRKKKQGLILSIVLNLGLLFTFKYYNFFQNAVHDIFWLFDYDYTPRISGFLLPVGISFYTFQTLSYSVDVYRNHIKPEKHFGKFALYVSFFPQLIAGPIERASDLLPQLKAENRFFKSHIFSEGALIFLWGMFKKVVVADNLRAFTDPLFNSSDQQNAGTIVYAMFLFSFQFYADFSGYTDMAIGSAKMLGIDLKQNFKTPYFSQNLREFWSRWHITFSSWLKDYVYIPLGGSRRNKFRNKLNLFITYFLSGIWHGASWNYIIWGSLHGLLAIAEQIIGFSNISRKYYFLIPKTIITFLTISIMWIPFRANNFEHLKSLVVQIFTANPYNIIFAFKSNGLNIVSILVIVLILFELLLSKKGNFELFRRMKIIVYPISIFLILMIFFLGNGGLNEFYYFRF